MVSKSCETCRWSKDYIPDDPAILLCHYPTERLPLSMQTRSSLVPPVRANLTGCPCWAMIPPKNDVKKNELLGIVEDMQRGIRFRDIIRKACGMLPNISTVRRNLVKHKLPTRPPMRQAQLELEFAKLWNEGNHLAAVAKIVNRSSSFVSTTLLSAQAKGLLTRAYVKDPKKQRPKQKQVTEKPIVAPVQVIKRKRYVSDEQHYS